MLLSDVSTLSSLQSATQWACTYLNVMHSANAVCCMAPMHNIKVFACPLSGTLHTAQSVGTQFHTRLEE
jgi:hypothetical protein